MSGGAAAAAAAAQRRRQQEEEEMTLYQPQDLSGDWEFKILRSATGSFGRPGSFKKALDEEARAGWTLVEKFDNQRIRLKRPVSARSGDGALGFDPYRTFVGLSEVKFALALVALIFGVLAVIFGVMFYFLPH